MLTSDTANCIYRLPPPSVTPTTSHLAAKHPLHLPVFLRSTKLPLPKANAAIRITELLTELGINTQKLVMPTRINMDIFERVLLAASGLVDMKRQFDRVEQEFRTLRALREGFIHPVGGGGRKVRRSEGLSLTAQRLGLSRSHQQIHRRQIGEAVSCSIPYRHRVVCIR